MFISFPIVSVNVWTAAFNSICLWLNWFEHKIHLTRVHSGEFIRWITCGEVSLCAYTTYAHAYQIFTKFKWKRVCNPTHSSHPFISLAYSSVNLVPSLCSEFSQIFFFWKEKKVVVCLFSIFLVVIDLVESKILDTYFMFAHISRMSMWVCFRLLQNLKCLCHFLTFSIISMILLPFCIVCQRLNTHILYFIRFFIIHEWWWIHKNDNGQITWDDCLHTNTFFLCVCCDPRCRFHFWMVFGSFSDDDDVNQKLKSQNVIYLRQVTSNS